MSLPSARSKARRLTLGTVSINQRDDCLPPLPARLGWHARRYGRELSSSGIREFIDIQTIRIEQGPASWRKRS